MNPFKALFIANLKIVYRNKTALFWNAVMPVSLYTALSVLPLPQIIPNVPYRSYLLPGMIAYTIMTNGIYGLAYWMAEMRSRNVIKRFLVMPIKIRDLALSLVASRLVVMFCQVLLLTLVGMLFFKVGFAGNLLALIILVILGGGVFLLIGLLIANYSSSYETATPLTTAIGLPMAFLGNIFFPSDALPKTLKLISNLLPITYLADALRQTYLAAFNWTVFSKDCLMLMLWLLVLFLTTTKIFKLKE